MRIRIGKPTTAPANVLKPNALQEKIRLDDCPHSSVMRAAPTERIRPAVSGATDDERLSRGRKPGVDRAHPHDDELQWSAWMAQAQNGDESSYRLLLGAVGKAIESHLRRRLGPVEFLEDIVQESLLAMHQARHTYLPDRPFRPWMFAIVRYKTVDLLRRRNVGHDPNRREAAGPYPLGVSQAQTTGDSGEALLEGAQLFQGIKPQSRQALVLTKVIGFSLREAADKLGVSEVAMKVRVHRALRELRNQLKCG